jgi:hypothetical protein
VPEHVVVVDGLLHELPAYHERVDGRGRRVSRSEKRAAVDLADHAPAALTTGFGRITPEATR